MDDSSTCDCGLKALAYTLLPTILPDHVLWQNRYLMQPAHRREHDPQDGEQRPDARDDYRAA